MRRSAQTVADGVGAREWLEMGGRRKKPLVMSELGCADGCGRGIARTAAMSELGCADGCGREMGAENCADGCGRRGVRRSARTVADGVGVTEWGEEAADDERAWLRGRLRKQMGWLEMGGEKKSLVMSELGCADGCGRQMGAENCADGCGRRGCQEWLEMGGEKKPLVMSELGCADGCGREMGAENCADGCGRLGCKGVAGNGWGEEAAGDERARLRGRLRMGNGCRALRERLRTAWVQGSGWKWVGRRSRW